MATTLEIVRAISQAAANSYDGAHNERYSYDGEERKIGLKREEGDPIVDSRIMDGFGVKFHGDRLIINYHSDIRIKEVHNKNFESDVEDMIQQIANFLKKEYKAITGDSLSLKADGEVEALVQNTSGVRAWVQAHRAYKINNLKGVEEVGAGSADSSDKQLDKSIKDWLAWGKEEHPKTKKPSNVTRKNEG